MCTCMHREIAAISNAIRVNFHIYSTCRMLLDYIFNRSKLLLALHVYASPSKNRSTSLFFSHHGKIHPARSDCRIALLR